jgi:hypothetical protein
MEKRKLSDAFLEFIEPILQYFGNPKPMTQSHDAACALGHVVWNAVILDELDPEMKHLTKAKHQGGNLIELNCLIDLMATRKKTQYASDKRIIGVYDIRMKEDGSFAIWTEIHDDVSNLH